MFGCKSQNNIHIFPYNPKTNIHFSENRKTILKFKILNPQKWAELYGLRVYLLLCLIIYIWRIPITVIGRNVQ